MNQGWQNVVNANGIALSITGILIVFVALMLVSLFISALPRMLAQLNNLLPEVSHHHGPASVPSAGGASARAVPEETLVAAIGLALHHRRRKG